MKIHTATVRPALRAAVLMLSLIVCGMRAARAEEFRIESKVFTAKEEAPVSESLTLFDDGRVYDFLSLPSEITLFDLSRGRIVLMDPDRKLRTELTTDELNTFIEQLRTRAARQTDRLLKFAADPKFEESRESSGWQRF